MRWALCGWLLVALPAAAREPPSRVERRSKTASLSPQAEAPEELLARAAQAYVNNDFRATVVIAHDLLYPDVMLRTEEDVQSAHRLLALAYFLTHADDSAEREFTALLAIKPDFTLDPVVDPPQAIAFLDRLKARERQRLDEIERRRRDETEAAAREEERRQQAQRIRDAEERVRREARAVVIERHSLLVSLVPFGAGQFQNGQRAKGGAFLGTQLALGATSLALWITLEVKYDAGKTKVPQPDFASAQAMQYASIISGAVFWADVGWGIVDALVHYQPQVTTIGPPGSGATPPSPAPPVPHTTFGPYLLPRGGAGLTVQGAF